MSKSYGNGIFLKDTLEELRPKVKSMFTDPARLRKTDAGNPEVCNLFPYHALMTDDAKQAEIRHGCVTASLGCVECKKIFLASLENFLAPLHQRRSEIVSRPGLVEQVLYEGNVKARAAAEKTMEKVRAAMHLV